VTFPPIRNVLLAGVLGVAACANVDLDAGADHPRGPLPVDQRNPLILANDGARDNWQGEFAMTLASAGQLQLAGIVVDASAIYPSLADNLADWRAMADAARASGMRGIPDPLASAAPPLVRPASGDIDATAPNVSDGARFIVDTSAQLAAPVRPVVVATGGRLTDLADAYLIDHSVADRVVIVTSSGQTNGQTISTGWPNGDLDPWATTIVVAKFRYVQVNAYYAQADDVPPSRAADLPSNPFGAWLASKLGDILKMQTATDQNAVSASAMATFALDVLRASAIDATPSAGQTPVLTAGTPGGVWSVARGDNAGATVRFWQLLKDPSTFGR
jgi:hypothetical protein